MPSTGKKQQYRCYTSANRRPKGRTACTDPIPTPMGEFDRLILGALADQLLTPERLPTIFRATQNHRHALASGTSNAAPRSEGNWTR